MITDPLFMASFVISAFGTCSAIGGCLAYAKHRSPMEGVLLGLLLGPIGVLVEFRNPYVQRPMVDQNAWNSLNSMMTYQKTGREYDRRAGRAK